MANAPFDVHLGKIESSRSSCQSHASRARSNNCTHPSLRFFFRSWQFRQINTSAAAIAALAAGGAVLRLAMATDTPAEAMLQPKC
eukprot:gene2428-biopygen11046